MTKDFTCTHDLSADPWPASLVPHGWLGPPRVLALTALLEDVANLVPDSVFEHQLTNKSRITVSITFEPFESQV